MPKFLIKKSRYINGQFVAASPEFPAEIETDPKKTDLGLFPVGSKEAEAEKPKPHYVPKDNLPGTAKELHSTPLSEHKKGKRASDSDIA